MRSAVEFIIGRGDRMVMGEIGLTPRAKRVIELAVDEARRLNHHYIGTEHLSWASCERAKASRRVCWRAWASPLRRYAPR